MLIVQVAFDVAYTKKPNPSLDDETIHSLSHFGGKAKKTRKGPNLRQSSPEKRKEVVQL